MAGSLAVKVLLVALLAYGGSARDLLQTPSATDALTTNPDLSTVAAAISAANISIPSGATTLFLPLNAGFAKALNTSSLTCVSGTPTSDLTTSTCSSANSLLSSLNLPTLLLSHVVNGLFPASSLANGTILKSVGGTILTAQTVNGTLYINNAPVVQGDVQITNGIVHLLGDVISKDAAFDLVTVPGVEQPVPGGYNYTTVVDAEKMADVGPFGSDTNQTFRELILQNYETYTSPPTVPSATWLPPLMAHTPSP